MDDDPNLGSRRYWVSLCTLDRHNRPNSQRKLLAAQSKVLLSQKAPRVKTLSSLLDIRAPTSTHQKSFGGLVSAAEILVMDPPAIALNSPERTIPRPKIQH